jgi:hypothetical protein
MGLVNTVKDVAIVMNIFPYVMLGIIFIIGMAYLTLTRNR